jgi:hypothetical protein
LRVIPYQRAGISPCIAGLSPWHIGKSWSQFSFQELASAVRWTAKKWAPAPPLPKRFSRSGIDFELETLGMKITPENGMMWLERPGSKVG